MDGNADRLAKDWARFWKRMSKRRRPTWTVAALLVGLTVAGSALAVSMILQWTVTSQGPSWTLSGDLPATIATGSWVPASLSAVNRQPGAAQGSLRLDFALSGIACSWISLNEVNAASGNATLGCAQAANSVTFVTSAWTVNPLDAHTFQIAFVVSVNGAYSVTAQVV